MNAELLLNYYEQIADAPDAVAQLRRFVLDLAVRGKLVPQDPSDEPASELLKSITKDRITSTAEGRYKPISGIPNAAQIKDWDVPDTWIVAPLPAVVYFQEGPGLRNWQFRPAGIPFLNIRTLQNGRVNRELCQFLDPNEVEEKYQHFLVRKGDILCSTSGTIGKLAVVTSDDLPLMLNTSIVRFCSYGVHGPDHTFIKLFLGSSNFLSQATESVTGSAQVNMGPSHLKLMVFPLPPLAEQRRIVARVDELMALCDQLEQARAEREARRDRLAAATLARLSQPADEPREFREHAAFALEQLAALTTRPDQVKALRQTILNLAVRGKLVAQDAGDEPASELLMLSQVEARRPDDIPATWNYIRLDDILAEDTRNGYSRRPDDAPDGTPILRISAGTVRTDGVVAEEEHKMISGIDDELRRQYKLEPGDLLACRFNGNKAFVGRLTIFVDYLGLNPIYPDKLIRIRVSPQFAVPAFLRLAGDSDLVRSEVEAFCATTVGNWGISASNLKEVRFPLPPLTEQRRIVAKVDELMALCDALEASLATGDGARRRLLDAVLYGALAE